MQAPSFASFPSFDEPSSKDATDSTPPKEASQKKAKARDHEREERYDRSRRSRSRSKERKAKARDREAEKKRDDRNSRERSQRSEKASSRRRSSRSRSPSRRKKGSSRRERRHSRERGEERELSSGSRKKALDTTYYDTGSTSVLDARPLFFVDRRGDPLNVQYGGLHAGDVPKHRLVGGGRQVLGLPPAFIVLHRGHRGVEVGIGSRRRLPTLTDSSSRKLLSLPPTRTLRASSGAERAYPEIDGVLRLPSAPKRERAPEDTYRAIETAHAVNSSSESSSEAEESSEEEEEERTLSAREQTLKELEGQLSSDPTNAKTWLTLLSHTRAGVPPTSKNATQAQAEVALAVLSRARKAHPQNMKTTALVLAYLGAGEEVWNQEKLRAEWEDALRVTNGDAEVVMEWLDWRVRKADGGIDRLVGDGERAMKIAKEEVVRLRVFWRIAVALQEAGYIERAIALFQAQAELAFGVPKPLQSKPFADRLESLEEFWDSEVPRIGELNALGWSAYFASPTSQSPPAPQPPTPSTSTPRPDDDLYTHWARQEQSVVLRMPARADDGDEDPYATVLFADIRPLLFDVTHEETKQAFRLVWLAFLGLRVPGFEAILSNPRGVEIKSEDGKWSLTHLAHRSYIDSLFPPTQERKLITGEAHAGVVVGAERRFASRAFAGPIKGWGQGVFSPLSLLSEGGMWMWRAEDVAGVDAPFVRRIFEQLRVKGDVEWDTLALAFEAAINVKGALKLSKTLLATSQDSLHLWSAHAQLERLRGRPSDARKVYTTVLPSVPASSAAALGGAGRMYRNWAEMEWLAGDADGALSVVLRAAGVEGTSGVGILRAKRALNELCTAAGPDKVDWVVLRAMLELLVGGGAEDMLSVVDRHTPAEGAEREALTVAGLLVLFRHAYDLRRPTPPALLRSRASAALEEFPNDTVLFGLFLEAERGHGVWGRVREALAEREGKGMERRVAEVWIGRWEVGKWDGEKERIRSGLATALQDDRFRGSPLLWRIAVELEIRDGALRRGKQLLFRAVGECPMCKELYLLAFGPLRSVFTPSELNALSETMAERGIRMRVGLDEAAERWKGRGVSAGSGSSSEGEDYGEEDIEGNAEELRRLRPY